VPDPAAPLDDGFARLAQDQKISIAARSAVIANTVHSVQQDFRRLVDTLERTLDLVGTSDEELRIRLSRTRDVAERGCVLSKLLVKFSREKRGLTVRR